MPTYEFRCSAGHTFEQFHRMSDAPSTAACPTCGVVAERAISGGAGLVFKGSGFYLTDYGKNAHRASGPAKGAEGTGGEGKSGGEGSGAKEGGGGGRGSPSGGGSGDAGGSGASGGAGGGSAAGSPGASGAGGSGGGSAGGSSAKGGE